MRRTLALSLFLLMPAALTMHSQNIVGQWQGILQTPKPIRIVLAVSSPAGANLQAYVVSLDQSPEHFPVTAISMKGRDVDFSVET